MLEFLPDLNPNVTFCVRWWKVREQWETVVALDSQGEPVQAQEMVCLRAGLQREKSMESKKMKEERMGEGISMAEQSADSEGRTREGMGA